MSVIDVAVGVILNAADEVLISFRHPNLHQGNRWEFPGGKLEPGESVEAALRRELFEELGLVVQHSFPLKQIRYQYPDKSVVLHVRRIDTWTGEPRGREGQAVAWRALKDLRPADFPAANAAIIDVLQLPPAIAITPDVDSLEDLHQVFDRLLQMPAPLIQLRQTAASRSCYLNWYELMRERCQEVGSRLLFNGELADFRHTSGEAYHANSIRLMQLSERPVGAGTLFSASCHDLAQLRQAAALQADFVFLSPVGAVAKYGDRTPLGWDGFRELAGQVSLPVYALGGVGRADLAIARSSGAHGICGIRAFLSD